MEIISAAIDFLMKNRGRGEPTSMPSRRRGVLFVGQQSTVTKSKPQQERTKIGDEFIKIVALLLQALKRTFGSAE
jgi:hypothetical protein